MKKYIKLSNAALIVSLIGLLTFNSQRVNATVGKNNTGTLKIVSCNVMNEGIVIMIGTHCITGTQQCIENPCY